MSALQATPSEGHDPAQLVPAWSGTFTEVRPGVGYMMIHVGDTRRHRFPPGWHPREDEPLYLGDSEFWLLEKEDEDGFENEPEAG